MACVVAFLPGGSWEECRWLDADQAGLTFGHGSVLPFFRTQSWHPNDRSHVEIFIKKARVVAVFQLQQRSPFGSRQVVGYGLTTAATHPDSIFYRQTWRQPSFPVVSTALTPLCFEQSVSATTRGKSFCHMASLVVSLNLCCHGRRLHATTKLASFRCQDSSSHSASTFGSRSA